MNCTDRDPDLLLTAQGQSDWATALMIRLHLLTCECCRERYRQFQEVSLLLHQGTHLSGQTAPPTVLARNAFRMGMGTVVLLLVVSSLLLFAWNASHRATPTPLLKSRPCRPDLPTDHCT